MNKNLHVFAGGRGRDGWMEGWMHGYFVEASIKQPHYIMYP